ncbi:MAG: ATP-binding protein [Myxococcota bacterium]
MGLRARVIVMLVVAVVPITAVFSLVRVRGERALAAERALARVSTRIVDSPRGERLIQRCQRAPGRFIVRQRGVTIHAYDASLAPVSPNAPALEPELVEALRDAEFGEPVFLRGWTAPVGVSALRVHDLGACPVLRLQWGGPRGPHGPPGGLPLGMILWQSLLLSGVLVLTGAGIALPLVRRISKLTDAVKQAPERDWTVDVERNSADEIGELARAFHATGRKVVETIRALEERDAALEAYVSNTTHDLAIPLTVLQHRLRAAQKALRDGEELDPELLGVALEESHYIGALISNMSAAAKLEAAQAHVKLHEMDLAEVVARVVSRHEPIAQQRDVELGWAAPEVLTITGDSTLIEQACSNLVQNAIQYNARGGHVAVVLEPVGELGFELKVFDDGPGVPDAMLGSLTEREVRGDAARSRNPGGLGFGLAIVRKVCEVHGFGLQVENAPEGGFVVVMTRAA